MNAYIRILVAAFIVNALSAENARQGFSLEEFDVSVNHCLNITKAKQDDIQYIIKDKIPDTNEQACLISCVYEKMNVGYKNGTVNIDSIIKMIEAGNNPKYTKPVLQKIKTVFEQCNREQPKSSKDACEAAKTLTTCYIQKAKKNGIPLEE